jgi:serine/threonine protein kinase
VLGSFCTWSCVAHLCSDAVQVFKAWCRGEDVACKVFPLDSARASDEVPRICEAVYAASIHHLLRTCLQLPSLATAAYPKLCSAAALTGGTLAIIFPQESFRKEIELLQSCNHDNIVGFRAACTDAPGHLMLVMELMQNGDLRSALHSDTEGALRWYRTCVIPPRAPLLLRACAVVFSESLACVPCCFRNVPMAGRCSSS